MNEPPEWPTALLERKRIAFTQDRACPSRRVRAGLRIRTPFQTWSVVFFRADCLFRVVSALYGGNDPRDARPAACEPRSPN